MFYSVFDTDVRRQSRVSDWALANFAFSYNYARSMRSGNWWLRSANASIVYLVSYGGDVGTLGYPNYLLGGLRPALVLAI